MDGRDTELRSVASDFLKSYNASLQGAGKEPINWSSEDIEYAINRIIAESDFQELWDDVRETGGVGRIEIDLIYLAEESYISGRLLRYD